MIKTIGILIILNSLVIPWLIIYFVPTLATHLKLILGLCGLSAFIGLIFTFEDRVTEITMSNIGTIKTAKDKAIADANEIENLRKRIEGQSATVDAVAGTAAEAKKMSEQTAERNKISEQKLIALDNAIDKANLNLSKLEKATEYVDTATAAQNDDRKAFDLLRSWADNPNHPNHQQSLNVVVKILENHDGPIDIAPGEVQWNPGINPASRSLDFFRNVFPRETAWNRPSLLIYVYNRKDFSKVEVMDFLIDVMKNDPSLTVISRAGKLFNAATNWSVHYKSLMVEQYVEWWKTHKDEYIKNNKPPQK